MKMYSAWTPVLNTSCYHISLTAVSLMKHLSSVCPAACSTAEIDMCTAPLNTLMLEFWMNEIQFHILQMLETFSSVQMLSVHYSSHHALPVQKDRTHLSAYSLNVWQEKTAHYGWSVNAYCHDVDTSVTLF